MKAYLGDPDLKGFLLEQLDQHRKMDMIVKGKYWENGRGCAVGCTLEAVAARNGKWKSGIEHKNHSLYVSELGIPEHLARLQDAIFEGLPEPDYLDWPRQFAEAIMPGADLSGVWSKFVVALLTDPSGPVWPHVQDSKWHKQRAAIEKVACLYRAGMPDVAAARATALAAWAAARAAALAAARAAARAAEAAARAAAYQWERDLLLRLLREAEAE